MCVALVIQHAMRLRNIVICVLPRSIIFSTLSQKRHDLREKGMERKMCVVISSTASGSKYRRDQLDATNSDLLVINSISTSFGHLCAHHQEIRLRSTAYSCLSCCSCCDVGESVFKMCAMCGECCLTLSGNILHTLQWNAIGSPDDGHKDARNMLRYYWLQMNHYLLHLVGLSFTCLSKMHDHSNIKFFLECSSF